MKHFFLWLPLLALIGFWTPARADIVTATVTVTNVPLGGSETNISVYGVIRRWTNATTASTIQTNLAGVNQSATNLFNAFGSFPQADVSVAWLNTNQIEFVGPDLTLVVTGSWASVVLSTNLGTNTYSPALPFDSIDIATRTNQAIDLAYGIFKYSTSAAPTNSPALTNHLSRGEVPYGGTQLVSSAVQFNKLAGGTNTGTIYGGAYETAGFTNVQYLYGFLGVLSNGTLYAVTSVGGIFTNGSFSGTIVTLTNGYWTNGVLHNPKLTNGVNYGNAFSSPGTNTGSQQFAGGTASGLFGYSFGGEASGDYSVAFGNGAIASGYGSAAFGLDAVAHGGAGTALGNGSGAGSNSVAAGSNAQANHTNAFAIGANSATTQDGEGMLGSMLVHLIRTFGRLQAGSITNATITGTNRVDGDWAWTPVSVSSLANGNNIAVPGTNYLLLLSGPTAAHAICGITGGRNGREILGQNRSTGLLTIANESGVDPTPANRILTPTRADVTVQTNGFFKLMWLDASSRWELQWKYP